MSAARVCPNPPQGQHQVQEYPADRKCGFHLCIVVLTGVEQTSSDATVVLIELPHRRYFHKFGRAPTIHIIFGRHSGIHNRNQMKKGLSSRALTNR